MSQHHALICLNTLFICIAMPGIHGNNTGTCSPMFKASATAEHQLHITSSELLDFGTVDVEPDVGNVSKVSRRVAFKRRVLHAPYEPRWMYVCMCVCMYVCMCTSINMYIHIYTYTRIYTYRLSRLGRPRSKVFRIHPVSITRFPLIRFSPGSGLLRNPFVHR